MAHALFLGNRPTNVDGNNWTKPYCYKLETRVNFQASTDMATVGGTLMDENTGKCLIAFSMKLGKTSSVAAELSALRQGLALAWERRVPQIQVEINPEVIDEIHRVGSVENHPLRNLIEDCRALSRRPWVFNHSYLKSDDADTFACTLAKIGHGLEKEFQLWEEPPLDFFTGLIETINSHTQDS